MRRTHCAFVAMLILASQACGRTAVGETPQQPTAEPTLPGSPIPMSTEVVPTAPLSYPFEGRNMFFGLTIDRKSVV